MSPPPLDPYNSTDRRNPPLTGEAARIDAARRWLAHVEANRANVRAAMKPEHLLIHARNELVICGRRF